MGQKKTYNHKVAFPSAQWDCIEMDQWCTCHTERRTTQWLFCTHNPCFAEQKIINHYFRWEAICYTYLFCSWKVIALEWRWCLGLVPHLQIDLQSVAKLEDWVENGRIHEITLNWSYFCSSVTDKKNNFKLSFTENTETWFIWKMCLN